MKEWIRWGTAESRLIDRFARDLVSGRSPNAAIAARACVDALRRLHEAHPNAAWAAVTRTWEAVHTRLLDVAHATGGRWRGARWSARQDSLIRPFVTGLIQGRYRSANEAARYATAVLALSGPRRSVPFNQRTVQQRILDQAEARGWRPDTREWSERELRLLDDYARAVRRGRYRTARAAARAYLQGLDRLARRHRGTRWLRTDRTLDSVFTALVKRLKRLKAWSGPVWPEPELQLAERFAQGLIDGRYASARAAARDFLSARDDLRARLPEIVWLRRRRALRNAQRVINKQAHEMGRSVQTIPWGAPERRILDRYARAVARGRFRSILGAAPACKRVLARLHRLHPETRWSRLPRTLPAVEGQLQILVRGFGIPRNNGRWTPGELEIVDRFARRCGTPGYRTLADATRECVRELERRYRREMKRNPLLGPVQPRTLNAVQAVLRQRAIALRTWGPYAAVSRE